MSEFLQIKKNTGETVTNGVLDIGRARVHATTVERGAFTGSSYDLSSYRNLDHMSCIIKTFDGFSNPYVSKNGDSFVVWNRFWMNQSPNPKFTIQFLDSSGLATSSYTGSYGVKIFGNNKNLIIDTTTATAQIFDRWNWEVSSSTISGVYNGYVDTASIDISHLNLTTIPYLFVAPAYYKVYQSGAEHSFFAVVWYATKTTIYLGRYLLQTAGVGITIPSGIVYIALIKLT